MRDNDVPAYPPREPFITEAGEIKLPSFEEIGAVPLQELEALAEKWESSGMVEDEACAMELREVMEDYTDE